MAKDASLSVDAPRLPETSRPGQTGEAWGQRPWTSERVVVEDRDTPLPEVERKAIADKIWAWEQQQFPIKGPRLRLRVQGFRPHLSISKILEWADAHFAATRTVANGQDGSGDCVAVRGNVGRHPIGTEPGPAGPAGGLVAGPVAGRATQRQAGADGRADPRLGRRLPCGQGPMAHPVVGRNSRRLPGELGEPRRRPP